MVLRLSYQQGDVAHHVSNTNVFILNNRAHACFIIFVYCVCFFQHFFPYCCTQTIKTLVVEIIIHYVSSVFAVEIQKVKFD